MQGTVLSSKDTAENKTDMVSALELTAGQADDWRKYSI